MSEKDIKEIKGCILLKDKVIIEEQEEEITRLNNIINEIKNNWNDLTEDKVYLKMSKETLVKTIDIKRNTISYIRIKRDKLQERIDKAIEYIEKNWIEYSDFQYVDNDDELDINCESIKELIDILKGSDSNGN